MPIALRHDNTAIVRIAARLPAQSYEKSRGSNKRYAARTANAVAAL
jgi:hypothetical protein